MVLEVYAGGRAAELGDAGVCIECGYLSRRRVLKSERADESSEPGEDLEIRMVRRHGEVEPLESRGGVEGEQLVSSARKKIFLDECHGSLLRTIVVEVERSQI